MEKQQASTLFHGGIHKKHPNMMIRRAVAVVITIIV
jgi:hypothetical protein